MERWGEKNPVVFFSKGFSATFLPCRIASIAPESSHLKEGIISHRTAYIGAGYSEIFYNDERCEVKN
jgi:hypothetical protein